MSDLMSNLHIGEDSPENRRLIQHAGRIPMRNLEIAIGFLFGLSAISIILRTAQRLVTFRRLQLDDAFVWFALVCLSAATAILYKFSYIIMIQEAIAMEPRMVLPIDQVVRVLSSIAWFDAYYCIIWTCTFAVKASFLALFWKLIRGISKSFYRYYWIVVGYTIITWVFLMVEPFILCPYFGLEGGKCYPQDNYPKTLAITILITILDIISDILIASIPVLILRKTQMKFKQKASLGMFLCLSLMMAIFALIRIGGLRKGSVVDTAWLIFWQYVEGCVACIMASVTPFRIIFTKQGSQASHRGTNGPSQTIKHFWKNKTSAPHWIEMNDNQLPSPPGPVIAGLKTFMRRNNREAGESTVLVTQTFEIEESISERPGQKQDYKRNTMAYSEKPVGKFFAFPAVSR